MAFITVGTELANALDSASALTVPVLSPRERSHGDFAIDPLVNAILSKWMNAQQNSCRLNCAKVNRRVR